MLISLHRPGEHIRAKFDQRYSKNQKHEAAQCPRHCARTRTALFDHFLGPNRWVDLVTRFFIHLRYSHCSHHRHKNAGRLLHEEKREDEKKKKDRKAKQALCYGIAFVFVAGFAC